MNSLLASGNPALGIVSVIGVVTWSIGLSEPVSKRKFLVPVVRSKDAPAAISLKWDAP